MTSLEILSLSDFAKRMNIKRSYVTQLKNEGRLVMAEDGKRVVVEASIERIQATRDPSKVAVARRHAAERGAETPLSSDLAETDDSATDPETPAGADNLNPDYQRARAKREHFNAELAQLEFRKAAGDLMESSAVAAAVSAAVTALRTRIESWPSVLAPQLVGREEAIIAATLADHIEHSLNEVATQFAKLCAAAEDGAL